METLVLERVVKMVLEYDMDCLKKEKDKYQKLMWQAEINDLQSILKKLEKALE